MSDELRHANQNMPEPRDAEIIARCLRGDQQGYALLYSRYADGLYRLAASLVPTVEDAEDVVQESFVYAFRNLARYDAERSAFKSWLYMIAVSRCRNVYRRKQFTLVDPSALLHLNIPAPDSETPEAMLAQRSARDSIQKALQSLSPALREALVLRYGHGLTYREMADVLGCPQKTAESRVRLAHNRLRNVMQGQGRALLEELVQLG